MSDIYSHFDDNLRELIDKATDDIDLSTIEASRAIENLKTFSEIRPLLKQSEAEPPPVPTTRWGKVKAATAVVWDNETTRVLIKAGGTFAGVAVVVYSTIQKDHVLERQAMAQTTQRNS